MCQYTLMAVFLTLGVLGSAVFHDEHDGHKSQFHDPGLVQDKDHIKQHMPELDSEEISNLSDEELEFRLFKLHDFNNDTKLDGLEIFSALAHVLPWEPETREGKTREELEEEQTLYYSEVVDNILDEDDYDQDGYLSYLEYNLARRRERREMEKEQADKSAL